MMNQGNRRLWRIDGIGIKAGVMKGAHGFLKDHSLVVTFTLPLGLDAVVAGWLALIALDPSLSASFPCEC